MVFNILIPLQLSTGSAKACRWLDVFIADSVWQTLLGKRQCIVLRPKVLPLEKLR